MPFEKILLIVVAFALLYWLRRMKKQGIFRRHRPIEPVVTKIAGYEIRTPLELSTPVICLRHDGLRFGESFRVKHTAALPHCKQCRCEKVPLQYSSDEVFHGSLRKDSQHQTFMGLLKYKQAQSLKKILFAVKSNNLKDIRVFLNDFDWGNFSEAEKLRILLTIEHWLGL